MAAVVIRRKHWEEMRAQMAAVAPLEACGLLAGGVSGSEAVFAIENELASATHFRMNARQQVAAFAAIEEAGWTLLAIYHSHPGGPPHPSETDLAEALYPGVAHLIWAQGAGVWNCRAFLLDGGQIQGLEYQLQAE